MYDKINEQMDSIIEIAINATPKYAKIYRLMYDSLIKEGFNEEQALNITCSHKVS